MSESIRIEGEGHPPVSGLLDRASEAWALLLLAHGAGAPMTHPFMEAATQGLVDRGVTTLRYNFSYMEEGRKRPDPTKRLLAVVASAVREAEDRSGGLPVFAGGKSMGGRMTSTLLSQLEEPTEVRGLVFLGFPLHRPGSPGSERAAHLSSVQVPMLFLQGTRDSLADLDHLRPCIDALGPGATLHILEGADHSFRVLKRSGRTEEEVRTEMLDEAARWMRDIVE